MLRQYMLRGPTRLHFVCYWIEPDATHLQQGVEAPRCVEFMIGDLTVLGPMISSDFSLVLLRVLKDIYFGMVISTL